MEPKGSLLVDQIRRLIFEKLMGLLVVLLLLGIICEDANADPADFRKDLKLYCFDCHNSDSQEGGLDLESLLKEQPFVHRRTTWRRVAQVIELEAMPPEDSDQLPERDRERVANGIYDSIEDYDYESVATSGREPIRRLTNDEYDNTTRDLLGVDIRPAEKFPRDLTGATGFANEATTLSLQPALMERYIAAAERTVEAALPGSDPKNVPAEVVERLFAGHDPTSLDDKISRQVLKRFLQRAYRRPAEAVDEAATIALYDNARASGLPPLAAIKQTLPSVLVSPRFLMRIERPAEEDIREVDDWEMATRLSYFLWSTMPDEELFELASQGKLKSPEVLHDQIDRMTADPKFREFGRLFGGQWLSTNLVGREIRRDPIDEPWCTDTLMDTMRAETEFFLVGLFRENRPPTEMLTADYTYLNEELAKTLYGMREIKGNEIRKVSLETAGRRGILGHASVLAITSNNEQTSPVKRGAYVLETILGTPPPPPPPDAGELDPKIAKDRSLSLAEKIGRHASDPKCSSCHNLIDPLGQSLEAYGGFGRLRGAKDQRRILAGKAKLGDGTETPGLDGLVDHLISERREDYTRNLVQTLLEYSLGRPLDYRDEYLVRQVTNRTIKQELGMKQLLYAVVDSPAFRQIEQPQEPDHGS